MNAIAPAATANLDLEVRAASIDDLDAAICRISSHINAANYQLLLLVREFDDRLGWAQWSFRNCSEWLAWRCGFSLSAARERVRTAQALRTLPEISAAFEEGRLSYSKVRALTRAAEPRTESLLLAHALDATAAQVEERCRQIRNVCPESVDDARRVWERRSLSVWRNPERSTMTISVEVPLEDGEVITRALERSIEAGDAATGPEFAAASWQSQQADALVAVARAYLSGGVNESASSADHYQVVVHVDESALRGGAGRSDLPIDTLKRLACDGSLVTVMEDKKGTPLNVGRRQRTVSVGLRRALWSRDRGCSFPGCQNSRFVDAHHIRHWIEGGETSLENTTLLCTHHHRLVHEGRYRIQRDHDRQVYFRRSDGRTIPRCGFRLDDARPDPVALANTSAEGWLAAMVNRSKPSAEVREDAAAYRLGASAAGQSVGVQGNTKQRVGLARGAATWNVGTTGTCCSSCDLPRASA